MASSICRKVVTTASKLPIMARTQASTMMRSPHLFASAMPSGSRGFQVLTSFKGTNFVPCALTAQKRLAHSEVEKEMSSFLEKEIKYEESSKPSSKLPDMAGFQVETLGAEITMTKSQGGDKVVIKLNINDSVDADEPEPEAREKEEPVQMVSRPPFMVEIHKAGGQVLAFECSFPPGEVIEESMEQDPGAYVDHFEIQQVAIHNGDWNDEVYTLVADTMDGTLYDLLMDMLDEHGVGDKFVHQLVDFCTAYEHSKYVEFLKGLKSFVAK